MLNNICGCLSCETVNLSSVVQLVIGFILIFPLLSVSSFVKKTTEKINTLQMNSDLWQRPEFKEGGQADAAAPSSEDLDSE